MGNFFKDTNIQTFFIALFKELLMQEYFLSFKTLGILCDMNSFLMERSVKKIIILHFKLI